MSSVFILLEVKSFFVDILSRYILISMVVFNAFIFLILYINLAGCF